MIVAHLILAHRFPYQLERLIARLPNTSPIFIHFDARSPARDWSVVKRIAAARGNVRLVRRHRCYWGSYGIVAATVELVKGLVNSGESFDYAILLSGADYPIKSQDQIQAFLAENAGREHIECFALNASNRWDNDVGPMAGRHRYRNYFLRFRSRSLVISANRKPPLGLPLYCGTQWWALSAACIRYCNDFLVQHPRFLRFFKSTGIPDEAVFQTIIASSPFRDAVSGREPTLAIWGRPEPPYPATLTIDDREALIESPFLFARKMDPVQSLELLDWLDAAHAGNAAPTDQSRRIAETASATSPISAMPSTRLTIPRAS